MLDDLDLAWEEQEPRRRGGPPTRQARQRRRKEKKRHRRSFLALFISAVLLATLGLGVYWGVGWVQDQFGTPDYSSNPATTSVLVTVNRGDSSSEIAVELYNKKVVKSTKAFIKAAAARPDDAKKIQPGVYKLFEEMPASAAFAALLDQKNKQVIKVTIPEGLISVDIYKKISDATKVPVADFVEAAKDPVALGVDASWFTTARKDGRTPIKSVEGFLFPATYEFAPGMTAKQMLSEMVDAFNSTTGDLHFVDTVKNNIAGITPYEALIVASIAQSEAVNKEDFAKVAKVLYNRVLTGNFACACLGLDSEVNYYLRISGKEAVASEHLTDAQLHDAADPYNTHDKAGIPPGAIANPGEDALGGAMAPVGDTSTFYFMTIDKQGTMGYAKTYNQFLALRNQACRNGIPLC